MIENSGQSPGLFKFIAQGVHRDLLSATLKSPVDMRPVLTLAVALILLTPAAHAERNDVLLYPAFGNASNGAVVEGRVMEHRDADPSAASDGSLRNLVRNARLFKNEEQEDVRVVLRVGEQRWETVTDEEGYFQVRTGALLPASAMPGWTTVEASAGPASGEGSLLLLPPENELGLISDLDDTILVTGVNDTARMLGNTFLKNPAQREAVPAMAWLYTTVLAANPKPLALPLFYLSASPRQLHGAIDTFLKLNGFPEGVLITKRVTDDRTSEPLFDQKAYKLQKIEDILARTPGVRFLLVGDDGERDPDIYETVRRQHPERVEAIWIRRVNPEPVSLPAGQLHLSDVLRQVGLQVGK